MFFRQIYETGLAQASYIIGCQASGTALVIDPRRDIDVYLDVAEREKLKITHITESHVHADFLSGSRELAAATGATILTSDEGAPGGRYRYSREGIKDGNILEIGKLKVEVMHTPGHTPEHISFLVTDTPASDQPLMMFTGDFVFVGDVGRPDLLENVAGIKGSGEDQARMMFNSLQRFKKLPDFVQVHPAHGAGSACGKALGAVPSSTVGYEKLVNWALRFNDEKAFMEALLQGQPEPPRYFADMARLNLSEREVLRNLPHAKKLTPSAIEAAQERRIVVIDTRPKVAFAAEHIPGSLNIQDNRAFSTWAGWTIEHDQPFILIAPEERLDDLTRALVRIGLDNFYGYAPSIQEWKDEGKETASIKTITLDEFRHKVEQNEVNVLDVRALSEYNEGHIEGATHIHAGYLASRIDELPNNGKPTVVHCAAGDRSAVATSLLMQKGFKNIYNFLGGFNAWRDSGFTYVK